MTRIQSATTRPWVLRWLLILLAAAGLGLGTGSHCVDQVSVAPSMAPSVAYEADVVDAHDHGHVAGSDHTPAGTVEDCRPASPTATTVVAGGAAPLPVLVRTAPRVVPPACAPQSRPRPAVALTQIGISRI